MKMSAKSFLLIFVWSLILVNIFPQYSNIRVNNPASTDPEEVTIAINPMNPNQLAAGANIKYMYYSNNGGLSWTQKLLSSTMGVWGDPCVIYDGLNNLYFGHLSNPQSPGYWIDRIVVQKSTNNGFSFDDGAGIGYFYPKNQDKEWLAVDLQNTPYKNNIYTTWTEFDNYGSTLPSDSSRILFSRSTNQGISWTFPVRVSDKGGNCIDEDFTVEGAVPTVGPNGEIYVAWSGPLGIMFDKSTNGGQTFGNDIFVTDHPGGWDFNVPGISRCNGLPVTICDTSKTLTRGNIYVLWGDTRNGTDNTDVFIIKSTDNGNTWGSVIRVNDDNTTRHQFFPWIAVDQVTGYLYVVFYDRRNTSGNVTDVYVARSKNGGETFENFKVSESSFNPISSVFFGDYTNIAAYNGKIYPIWMKLDTYTLSVWTTIISDSVNLPVELDGFTVSQVDGNINLKWKTISEKNNKGFEIQRSINQSEFLPIGFVKGNGTTLNINNYEFNDGPSFNGDYRYRLKQIDYDGSYEYSNIAEINFIVGSYVLTQNYPNPFNPTTTISFSLPKHQLVTVKVFDALGNEVKVLVNEVRNAGVHEITFDASELSSGIYLYRLTTENFTSEKKMVLMK